MNQFKTVALLGLLSGILVGIGYWLGGSGGALIGLVIAAVTNFFSWYSSDKIALAAYRAQPISREQSPKLYEMVERLCQRADLPMPKLYVVPSQGANAFATGRDPKHAAVAVTQGIVNLLNEQELEGVLAHELSHVKNRDTLTQAVAATIAGAVTYFARVMQYGMMFGGSRSRDGGGNPIGLLLAIFLAPVAATIVQMAISRTREFEADAGAARMTGNPRALASALQKLQAGAQRMPMNANPSFEPLLIVNSLSGQFMGNLFSTHPATQTRIERLLQIEQELGRSSTISGSGV
jgi:heat shock protein HtpX